MENCHSVDKDCIDLPFDYAHMRKQLSDSVLYAPYSMMALEIGLYIVESHTIIIASDQH